MKRIKQLTTQEREQKRGFYLSLVLPAVIQALDVYIDIGESKYNEGLNLDDPHKDAAKAIQHLQRSLAGHDNPDGNPHYAASLSRIIKVVLAAQNNNEIT